MKKWYEKLEYPIHQNGLYVRPGIMIIGLGVVILLLIWQNNRISVLSHLAHNETMLHFSQNQHLLNNMVQLEKKLETANRWVADFVESDYSINRQIESLSDGVCLIQGEYTFINPVSLLPLRRSQVDLDLQMELSDNITQDILHPSTEQNSILSVKNTQNDPPFIVHYTGTGFLIDRNGFVATNKHITAPWLFNNQYKLILAAGYEPQMIIFRAFFPNQPRPFDLTVCNQLNDEDVALLKCSLNGSSIPTLPCSSDKQLMTMGHTVTILGYPTGFDVMLARLPKQEIHHLIGTNGTTFENLALEMARHWLIQPIATRGICSQVQTGRIIYDAPTTSGGSGAPVLNDQGQVVAINTAVVNGFNGTNIGVPIDKAVFLLNSTLKKSESQ